MRLLFFVLLIVLIAQVGFWNTLGAVIGAVAMMLLLFGLGLGVVIVGGFLLVAASLR